MQTPAEPNHAPRIRFGFDVAVSGEVLLVESWANTAYIYAFNGRTWEFSEKIGAPSDLER